MLSLCLEQFLPMSTVPHDTSNRADTASLIATGGTEVEFAAVVRDFESIADGVGMPRPPAAELHELCRQVADVSRRIFRGDVKLKVVRDWEIQDDIYFVVDVRTEGTPDEVVAQANEWHLALQ